MDKLLDLLAKRHLDWIRMARSLPGKGNEALSIDNANELVQLMYLKLYKYINDVDRIMYNETEINTMFVYITLRNLYYDQLKYNKRYINCPPADISLYMDNIPTNDIDSSAETLKMVLEDNIQKEINGFHHYDAKLFKIIFTDEVSMRQLSRATNISLASIFNSIKQGKLKLKLKFQKDWDDYNNKKKQ